MKDNKNRRTLIITAALAVILALAAGLYIFFANRYAAEHSVAVIYAQGERHGETDDAFEGQSECRTGGQITVGDVVLEVVKIDWKGSVTFKVIRGELKDKSGGVIESDTLAKGERKYYKSAETSFSVAVKRIEKK